MKIDELLFGLASTPPKTLGVEPNPSGLTVVPIDLEGIAPSALAEAIRETLARAERNSLAETVPFIRVKASTDEVEIAVADDAALGLRLLTETRAGGVPLILEAKSDEDVDALLRRIGLAAGTEDPDVLFALLARSGEHEGGEEISSEALLYLEAQRRASALAREVRAIDERMTASIVPDWLWIATGFGGVGVFLTVIALLYPDLRIYVVPALCIFALLGFSAYARRSWRELKLRGALQIERRELRARREAARAEARARAEALEASGGSPEDVLIRHERVHVPATLPAIIAPDLPTVASLASRASQTIVLLEGAEVPGGIAADRVRRLRVILSV